MATGILPIQKRVHYFETNNGWRIALSRYQVAASGRDDTNFRRAISASDESLSPAPRSLKKNPVLLVHGLAANHLTFDLLPERSFARFLAQKGYDVWSLDLRGRGLSEKSPDKFQKSSVNCNLDDYLAQEMDLALAYIRKTTHATKVHGIGHSMGGILFMAYLASRGSTWIQSSTTIASSLDYSQANSHFDRLMFLRKAVHLISGLPVGLVGKILAPFVGWFDNFIERFSYWPKNVDFKTARTLHKRGFHTAPANLLDQMISGFQKGGLRSADGKTSYAENLAKTQAPVMMVAGDEDRQCPPQAVEFTFSSMASNNKKLAVFGKAHGHATHYGHFDLLVGRHAQAEVYPQIVGWLDQHDGRSATAH